MIDKEKKKERLFAAGVSAKTADETIRIMLGDMRMILEKTL